ncbi:hypothetical protein [Clostridium magnum]|uniref:Uncharacterized protein n=1 Tax=Clostridium magnum DSM 2767 TaxID=1121326 RepID=A0A162U6V2_9CLOT|nr:hypothetical protein [Clostridium magnum]KZL93597.1 hypothetical protein CLMAG_06430 [Clostridium magnum DSM 2767]SHI58562.1 hypothetical protein SAMN02745944_04533 [Clostridium magnum DSM 2767]
MSVDELEPSILSERIAIGKMPKRKKGEYFYKLPSGYKPSIDNKTGEKIIYCKTCGDPIYLIKEPNIYRCLKGCSKIEKVWMEDFLLNKIINDLLSKRNLEHYQEKELKKIKDEISKEDERINKIRSQQHTQMYELIKSFNPNTNIDYSRISDLIYDEKNKEKDIDKKKNAVQINIALEQIAEIYQTSNNAIIINKFKRSIGISQELFKSTINKIVIKNNEKVKLSEPGSYRIDYIK